PGVLHHVMIRGIEKTKIFTSNKDREYFIEGLDNFCPEMGIKCYAWTFMHNHAHVLFHTGKESLSRVMRRLLTGYVIVFNHSHKRRGHLFQNRFKSIICQEETYLRELVRYIHLNPIRAGIITTMDELRNYKYTSHSAIMGNVKREWQDTEYVLGYFGKSVRKARKEYESFVNAGLGDGRKDELTGGGLIRSLAGGLKQRRY
ncbi:MAG: transposase, partial [Deltaproteobacteria bacterium]|nr:transposase [Deltaproteobacteria bacterium]